MAITPNTLKSEARLEHIKSYVLSGDSSKASMRSEEKAILERNGDMWWRTREFNTYFLANALFNWFVDDNLAYMKSRFFNQAKIRYICTVEGWDGFREERLVRLLKVFESLPILLSDHEAMIKWYSNFDSVLNHDHVDDHHSYDYLIKNFFIAMRGEWDLLEERSRKYIEDPRPKPLNRWIMDTYEYYLGLATGDITQMEKALAEFVKPRFLRSRADIESGYTEGLISTEAVVLAKLAWRNGYEVKIDSPYVPKEWLPVQPLDHYEDEFDFMKAYTIDPTWGGKFR